MNISGPLPEMRSDIPLMAESSRRIPLRTLEGLSRCTSLTLRTSDFSEAPSCVLVVILRRSVEMILIIRPEGERDSFDGILEVSDLSRSTKGW